MTDLQLNPGFDINDFLGNYWQKKPLYIPQLFSGFEDPISPEELAGLAMEADCESRLVEGNNPEDWAVSHGPFAEDRFTSLPQEAWTLLVQAVDQWNEPVYELKQLFKFLPQWRLEDIMVSFAAHGSGVGPHFDYYDVFLVQGSGQRKWQVGPKYTAKSKTKNCSGLSILGEFEVTDEYLLQSGDALYIPPQYGHWGTSIQRSLCYSIGCRAPSTAEILEGFSDFLIDRCPTEDRYTDPNPAIPIKPGEITVESLTPSFHRVVELLENKENYIQWFGQYATRPKYQGLIEPAQEQFKEPGILEALKDGAVIAVNPSSRLSFHIAEADGATLLFVDGETIHLAPELSWYGELLCRATEIHKEDLAKITAVPAALEQTAHLLNQGSLILY